MVVMRTDLALARMTHTPSSMMKITIDFDETSSLSSATYHCQIMVVMRTDLALGQKFENMENDENLIFVISLSKYTKT